MDDIVKGCVGETRALMEEYQRPEVVTLTDPATGTSGLFVKGGKSVSAIPATDFDSYRDMPARRRGVAALLSLDSFIDHANRFKDGGSVVFANDDRAAPSLTAVLDYHFEGGINAVDPRFGQHRGTFAFPLSDEWKAWTAKNVQPMKMTDFAEFIEDRINDVLHVIPEEDEFGEDLQRFMRLSGGSRVAAPERLVELSRGLQVHESSTLREVRRLDSGEGQFMFTSEHSDENGQPLSVPNLFLIGIPVFRSGPLYRIAARLRYRKTPGGVVFWYDLWRTDRTFDHAFREACERVRTETELPLFFGKPE